MSAEIPRRQIDGSTPQGAPLPRNGRHRPNVDVTMLTPDNLLGRFHLLHRFFGHAGIDLVREIRNGTTLFDPRIRSLCTQADQHFFSEMATTFGNAHTMSPSEAQEFYITALSSANQAVDRFNQAFPEKTEIQSMNEVTVFDPSPSSLLYYLNSPHVSKRLRFEIERQIALGYIAGAIEARTRNSGLQRELATIQQIFNENLYVGDSGSTNLVITYSWHDNDTNEVVELAGNQEPTTPPRPSVHLKRHATRMREVQSVGNVSATFNMKDIETSILKAVIKAQRSSEQGNGGIVDIDDAVKDTIRAKMVVEGTTSIADNKIKKLIAKVTRVLERASEQGIIQPIESISRKDEKYANETKPRFKRLMVTFANLPIPFEIIFYDQQTDLNEKYHVGEMQKNGQFNGYAHSIYELKRLGKILALISPPDILQDGLTGAPYISDKDLTAQIEEAAFALRGANRVFPTKD